MQVSALNLAQRLAILDDGSTVPVTNMFDVAGAETDRPDDAVSFVAGSGALWFSYRADDFEPVSVQ